MDKPMRKCPSPFDYMAYTDWQRFHNGDPWKQMKTNAKLSEISTGVRNANAQKGKDLIFALKPKEFHVYSKAKG